MFGFWYVGISSILLNMPPLSGYSSLMLALFNFQFGGYSLRLRQSNNFKVSYLFASIMQIASILNCICLN